MFAESLLIIFSKYLRAMLARTRLTHTLRNMNTTQDSHRVAATTFKASNFGQLSLIGVACFLFVPTVAASQPVCGRGCKF